MLMDNTADILLDNIMRVMSGEYFGQTKAAAIVGEKKKLERLIESGKIEAVPTLMTFTLDNEGHITYLNVIGLVYSICTAFLWERMMPGYMVRYIKKLIRED